MKKIDQLIGLRLKNIYLSFSPVYWIIAALLSFFRTGSVFYYVGKVERNLPLELNVLIFGLRFLFYFVFFSVLLYFFDKAIKMLEIRLFTPNGLYRSFTIKEKIKDYIPFLVGWFPLLIIRYPAAMCWDTWRMLYEYRNDVMTEHHSVLYSVIMGKIVELFEWVGNANVGLFIWSFCHYIILVLAFGYSISIIRKMDAKKWVVNLITACYMLNPYISGYVGVAIKDTIYAALILILVSCLIDLLRDTKEFCSRMVNYIILFTTFVLTYLIRKNGSYTLLIVIIVVAVSIKKNKWLKIPVLTMIMGFVTGIVIFSGLGNYYNATPGSAREALSLPFQQTARYVRDYNEDITDEEKTIINQVLDFEIIGKSYKPRISDPVKDTYKEDDEKLFEYFKVWLSHFLRHPLCYIEATWEQNYYLFVPEIDNIKYYKSCEQGFEELIYYEDIFEEENNLLKIQEWIMEEINLVHAMPVIGWFGNVSIWFYLFVFMIGYCIVNKSCFIPSVPMLMSIMFVVLGPAIQGQPRYMFPVIYSMPVFCIWSLFSRRDKYEVKKNSNTNEGYVCKV